MVEAQSIGVCVILSVVHFVVDLGKLESCEIQTHDAVNLLDLFEKWSWTLNKKVGKVAVTTKNTLSWTREKHLRLKPNRPINAHCSCGCSVRQRDQIFALLLL